MTARLLIGDVCEKLAELPDESVHCVVTSPPYWGLRDYGVAGQIGLEPTMAEHIETMVNVFAEVWRILRKDGTLWLNYGDSYVSRGDGLKPKNLCLMPARIAIALQEWGWWVRSDIIWHKPNPMPESVRDRPTSAHEHVFLMSKSARYFYDAEAVKEPALNEGRVVSYDGSQKNTGHENRTYPGAKPRDIVVHGRNLRNVWTITTEPYAQAHFATFPTKLAESCILAGTSAKGGCAECGKPWVRNTKTSYENPGNRKTNGPRSKVRKAETCGFSVRLERHTETIGWSPSCTCDADTISCTVLDPFAGSGTTLMVAERLFLNSIGIELNPEYATLARARIRANLGRVEGDQCLADNAGPLFNVGADAAP